MNKFIQPPFIPFLVIMSLSFYQMAYYMKYLPFFNCLKMVIELTFIMVGQWQITELSEELNHCNEIMQKAVYQSEWYKCGPKVKQCVCMMLRQTQQAHYLSFLNGFFVLTNDFMVKVFKGALSFINYMKISGPL
uniref:Uncharacterized protein n=1 Tax=Cacopsylla melanoneura TaxID=428564 RepID=A0A8D8X875_9HEMI